MNANTNRKKRESITGRDGYIVMQALAYSIEAIERLPEIDQEWSNCQDMKVLLLHHAGESLASTLRMQARAKLTGRGLDVDALGKLMISATPAGDVIPLRPSSSEHG